MQGLIIMALVGSALSALIAFGTLFLLNRRLKVSAGGERDSLLTQIADCERTIAEIIQAGSEMASKAQLQSILDQSKEIVAAMAEEKSVLQAIETKLDKAQREVEGKEAQQQEIKSSKEEDETKLADLLATFADVSNESVVLEQSLASSLKHLDSILVELNLTEDQKYLLTQLSEALVSAGSRLRDLLTEYNNVNGRLNALQQQHRDLEEEYTKLVEQQLGG